MDLSLDICKENFEKFNNEQRYFRDAFDALGEYIKEYMNTVPKKEREKLLIEFQSISENRMLKFFRHPYTGLDHGIGHLTSMSPPKMSD